MENFSNREEPKSLEMKNVVESVTSFLSAHNNQCLKFELNPACLFLQTLKGAFIGRPTIKGHNFLPSFCLHNQGETKLKPAV